MRHALPGLALLLSVLVVPHVSGATGQATAPEPLTEIKAVVARYVAAREARDAAALATLFTDDADQLVSSGEWRRGRDAVVAGGLASSARSGGVRTIEVETVRTVAPGVVVADGRYDIASTATTPARRMWTTFVMVRRGDSWRISAIRNMRPAE